MAEHNIKSMCGLLYECMTYVSPGRPITRIAQKKKDSMQRAYIDIVYVHVRTCTCAHACECTIGIPPRIMKSSQKCSISEMFHLFNNVPLITLYLQTEKGGVRMRRSEGRGRRVIGEKLSCFGNRATVIHVIVWYWEFCVIVDELAPCIRRVTMIVRKLI